MNKQALTEADIRSKYITPALVGVNGGKWNLHTQIREEVYFTRGRVIVRGKAVKRGEAKKADYILSYKPNLGSACKPRLVDREACLLLCFRSGNTLPQAGPCTPPGAASPALVSGCSGWRRG